MTEPELRAAIVREAREWIGTPYVLNACVKGAGTDCARYLVGVLQAVGAISVQQMEVFSHDWFAHSDDDTYKLRLLRHARQIAEAIAYPRLDARPGCLVLLRSPNGKVHWHGGIVTEWPLLCHCVQPAVEEINASRHPFWMHKAITIFDPWQETADVR